MSTEEDKIIKTYNEYDANETYNSLWNPLRSDVALYYKLLVESLIAKYFRREQPHVTETRVLDAGCGKGDKIGYLLSLGFPADNLFGVDLNNERILAAKNKYPNCRWITGNSAHLDFSDEHFDYILQFTMFSSILEHELQQNIASELKRVLKKTGKIIWLDLDDKTNIKGTLRGMSPLQIQSIFNNEVEIDLTRVYLMMSLVQRIAPHSYLACQILETFKLWNQCLFGTISRK